MRILLVGVGTVGEAIARLAAARPWWSRWSSRTTTSPGPTPLQAVVGDAARFPVERIDARDRATPSRRWRGAIGLTWS